MRLVHFRNSLRLVSFVYLSLLSFAYFLSLTELPLGWNTSVKRELRHNKPMRCS